MNITFLVIFFHICTEWSWIWFWKHSQCLNFTQVFVITSALSNNSASVFPPSPTRPYPSAVTASVLIWYDLLHPGTESFSGGGGGEYFKAPLSYLLPLFRKLPQSVPVGPPWSSFSYVSWEPVTWLGGVIPSGPVVLTVFKLNTNVFANLEWKLGWCISI